MTISANTTIINSMMDSISTAIDAGAGAGLIRIYDSTRPSKGGTATTLLAELTFSDPSFSAASNGIITANVITGDVTPAANGTATWFRVVDSNSNFILDGDVGTDLILTNNSIQTTVPVEISLFRLTGPNL